MSYSVSGTSITLTRGDTFAAIIGITDSDNNPYVPVANDTIRFAMKRTYTDPQPAVIKDIPFDTLKLVIEPEDTKDLQFGKYVYDIQITKSNGEVDTFITKAKLELTEEVL